MSTQYVFRTLPFISCFLHEFWVPWTWKPFKLIALTEKKCKALSRTSWVYHFSLCLYHLFSWALFSLRSKENLEPVWFFLRSTDLLALKTHFYLAHTTSAVFAQPSDTSSRSQEQFVGKKKEKQQESLPGLGCNCGVRCSPGLGEILPRTVQLCVFNKALWYSLGFDNIPTLQHL